MIKTIPPGEMVAPVSLGLWASRDCKTRSLQSTRRGTETAARQDLDFFLVADQPSKIGRGVRSQHYQETVRNRFATLCCVVGAACSHLKPFITTQASVTDPSGEDGLPHGRHNESTTVAMPRQTLLRVAWETGIVAGKLMHFCSRWDASAR